MGHLFATGCGDGLILWWGLPAPNLRGPLEWGVGAPGAENSPSLAPSQSSPGCVSSSRLSPACCHSFSPPLPPSFLHSLPAQPQSTRAKRRAQAGAKPLEAQGGAYERGLTSAGPLCPQLLTSPGA